jgi:hypothetical protein
MLACLLLAGAAVWTNVLGVGDKAREVAHRIELIIDPPPDRPIEVEVRVTPVPIETPSQTPTPTPARSLAAGETPAAVSTPTPVPQRVRMDFDLYENPDSQFISEVDHEWCAVAGTQMVLAANDKAPLTDRFQAELAGRVGEWESRRDSHNGGWGPAAVVKALEAYGVEGYEVRTYETRADALRDAAKAIRQYEAPVLLLTWRGAHTWVMTGFRSDADPLLFDDAKVTGAYILDPWYPRVSSIWGRSDPPGTFQGASEMRRNYLPWHRPEGRYPNRDGLFVAIVPTQAQQQ